MQKAAKEKVLKLIFAIASVLFLCAPSTASSTSTSGLENRVELFLLGGENRTEPPAFGTANRVENYDSFWGTALESPVAPSRGASVVERSGVSLSVPPARTANLPSSASVSDIIENAWIPGREGITVSDRFVRFGDLYKMTQKTGIEYGLVRETVGGQKVYRIYSGHAKGVRLPSGPGTRIIGHTHPAGTRYPSTGPFSDQANINRAFLRSLEENPLAPVPHRRVIWGEGSLDNTIYHPDVLR